MALNLLVQFTIQDDHTSPFLEGVIVKSFWDDVSEEIKVHLYDDEGNDLGDETTGPTIIGDYGSRAKMPKDYKYKACDGSTLNSFSLYNIGGSLSNAQFPFPYAQKTEQENHWECVSAVVCDIKFQINATSVGADNGTGIGVIFVKANSSHGSPHYTLDPNATYAEASSANFGSSYQITNLFAGEYEVYAIDENECKAKIKVIVPGLEVEYGVRWRLEYDDKFNLGTTRVDIEEKEYGGSITEVKGGGDPVVLRYKGEGSDDMFNTFIPAELEINLISETHFQFIDLFTQSERQFRVKYYRNTGSGFTTRFVGFVLPMLYSEQYYTTTNYPITVIASDQLGTLKDLDFVDDFGNEVKEDISFMEAICIILRKTNIELNIHESVNIFEDGMDTGSASDSALAQAYINPSIYYKVGSEKVLIDGKFQTVFNNEAKKCDYVLNQLLVSFGARLYQADGYWMIELIEERPLEADARVFDMYNTYQTTGTARSIIEIKEPLGEFVSLTDRSGLLTILPSYNKIRFDIDNGFKNNLLTRGDFEERDIINGQFSGWGFDISSGQGISYGYEKYKEPIKESLGGLFIDFENSTSGSTIIITSEQFTLDAVDSFNLKFSFDIFFRPFLDDFFHYVDYSVKIGDRYFGASVSQSGLIDGEYIRAHIDDPLKWTTIEQLISTSNPRARGDQPTNITLEGPVIVKIRISNIPIPDFASIAALKDFVTDGVFYIRKKGYMVSVLDTDILRIYSLTASTEAESSPDIIRPDDYASSGRLWKLERSFTDPEIDFLLNGVLIDNVTLSVEQEFEQLYYEKEFNPDIKLDLIKDITHSDFALTSANIENPESDPNLERMVSNVIKLSDESVTSSWTRSYIDNDPSRALIDHLMRMYAGQVTNPSMKLSGSMVTNQEISFSNLFYAPFIEKNFIPMYLSIHDFDRSAEVELLQIKGFEDTGESIGPEPTLYEFTEEFTTEFDS